MIEKSTCEVVSFGILPILFILGNTVLVAVALAMPFTLESCTVSSMTIVLYFITVKVSLLIEVIIALLLTKLSMLALVAIVSITGTIGIVSLNTTGIMAISFLAVAAASKLSSTSNSGKLY